MAEQKLKGKVAIIGGGAKNLGGLISRTLAGHGARIVVHYNSAAAKGAAADTVAAIKEKGGDAFAIQADFTKVAELEKVFAEAKKTYGSTILRSIPSARSSRSQSSRPQSRNTAR